MNDAGKTLRRDRLRNGVMRAGNGEHERVSGKDVRAAAEAIVVLLRWWLRLVATCGDPERRRLTLRERLILTAELRHREIGSGKREQHECRDPEDRALPAGQPSFAHLGRHLQGTRIVLRAAGGMPVQSDAIPLRGEA